VGTEKEDEGRPGAQVHRAAERCLSSVMLGRKGRDWNAMRHFEVEQQMAAFEIAVVLVLFVLNGFFAMS
jgi:hypothetical protein